ncbi:hypothetical protein [Mycolicibacterium lutetiense]
MTLEKFKQMLQERYNAGEKPAPMSLDDYMVLLQQRSDEFTDGQPAPRYTYRIPLPPLLEWFILPTDEQFVELPTAAPKPKPTPRRYTPSSELRARRDKLTQQRDAIMFDGPPDRAAANISGAPRWKKLDRDITKVASLSRRIDALDYRIKAAEHREQHQN